MQRGAKTHGSDGFEHKIVRQVCNCLDECNVDVENEVFVDLIVIRGEKRRHWDVGRHHLERPLKPAVSN